MIARIGEDGALPSEQETPKWAESAAQIDVFATCLRQCRTELRVAENSKENGDATGEADRDDAACGAYITSHLAGQRKIPVPIVPPITTAAADHTPSPRTKSGGVSCADFGILWISGSGMSLRCEVKFVNETNGPINANGASHRASFDVECAREIHYCRGFFRSRNAR